MSDQPANPQTAACSPDTALLLFRRLEYYRNFMPAILGWTENKYAEMQEAKNADAVIAQYISETGVIPEQKPSE